MSKLLINTLLRWSINITLTILFTLGLARMSDVSGTLNQLTNSFFGLIPVVITPFLLNHYFLKATKRLCVFSSIGGISFSAAYVCGSFLFYKNNLTSSIVDILTVILWILCISILTTPVFAFLLTLTDKVSKRLSLCQETYTPKKLNNIAFFFIMWFVMFLSFLPSFLCQWPGNFVFDAPYQMTEVIMNTYKVHHPLLHTLMMGKAFMWGVNHGNASLGYSFYTLAQMFIVSGSFAGAMVYIKVHANAKSRREYRLTLILAFLYYAVFPIHSMFAISATKDVLFAAFYTIFSLILFRAVCEKAKIDVLQWILFFIFGCLMILFRKNAIFALVPAIPLFCISIYRSMQSDKNKNKVLLYTGVFAAVIIIMIVFSNLFNNATISALNAYDNGSRREAMSVPLQQLGRVACYKSKTLAPELYAEICQYIPEEYIQSYNPFCADPMKNEANEQLLRSNFKNFLILWLKVGTMYPGEYVESFLTNTMGYWYPQATSYELGGDIASYHMLIGLGNEITKENYFPPASKYYEYLFYYQNYKKIPVLAMMFRPALYFWGLAFYLIAALYRKKYKSLAAVALPILYYASLFFGPMIALRYIYNLIVFTPVLVLSFRKHVLHDSNENTD